MATAYVLGAYVWGRVVLNMANAPKNPIANTALNHKAEVNVWVEVSALLTKKKLTCRIGRDQDIVYLSWVSLVSLIDYLLRRKEIM